MLTQVVESVLVNNQSNDESQSSEAKSVRSSCSGREAMISKFKDTALTEFLGDLLNEQAVNI